MSYKETSERLEEVIGGELFNPWEHRRFLPAQFERSCREDPECKLLHEGFRKWVYAEIQSIGKLEESGHPRATEIAADRKRFIPVEDVNPDATVWLAEIMPQLKVYESTVRAIRRYAHLTRATSGELIRFAEYAKAGDADGVQSMYRDYFTEYCDADLAEKQAIRFTRSFLRLCQKKDVASACEYIELLFNEPFVRAGVYYYKKSKGEAVTVDEVLSMSWDDILEYRRSVGKETTSSISFF